MLLTKTLLFVGEGTGGAGASPIFRAVGKTTGEILFELDLPDNQTACLSPMSMMANSIWPCSLAAVVIPHSWSLTRFPDSVACGLCQESESVSGLRQLEPADAAQGGPTFGNNTLPGTRFTVPGGSIPSGGRIVAACPRQ